jgi:hypothetical protein
MDEKKLEEKNKLLEIIEKIKNNRIIEKKLILYNKNLGDIDIKNISEALVMNNSLESLDIGCNFYLLLL